MNILEVDWKVARFKEREYALEYYAVRFCAAKKRVGLDGTEKMFEIFERMKELKMTSFATMNKTLEMLMPKLLKCISYLLGDDESALERFRNLVDEKFVSALVIV